MGLSWDVGDTALTIMNPAYGLYRLFGGRSPTSGGDDEGARPTGVVRDITQTAAYKAGLARQAALDTEATAADKRRAQAAAALQALRSASASSSYSPIAVNVPSFSIGREW